MTDEIKIGWCEEHLSVSMREEGDEDGLDCHVAHLLQPYHACRIVPAVVKVLDRDRQ
jgi:hypothetical protein